MKLEIERRPVEELSYETFASEFLKPERPVILTGLENWDTSVLTPGYVKEHFLDESKREAGWFDADLVNDDVVQTPDIVQRLLERPDMSVRPSPMRVFMQPGGHVTLPHYDGNSLHGLNLQIIGRKRWVITSPDTPLPNVPFMFVGLVGRNFRYDPQRYDFYEFETVPGDLLFLPRYFYHEVHSLDSVNLNLNWVFTPRQPNESSRLGQREVEIVKLRKSLPMVNKAFFPDDFTSYGGSGEDLIDAYSRDVGTARMLRRFLQELAGYPRLLLLAGQLRKRAQEFSSNNFGV